MPYEHIVFFTKPTNLSFKNDIEETDITEVKKYGRSYCLNFY